MLINKLFNMYIILPYYNASQLGQRWFSLKSELTRKSDDEKMSLRGKLTNLSPIQKRGGGLKVNMVSFDSSQDLYTTSARIDRAR